MVDKSHILSIKVTVLYWTRFIKNTYSILKCGFFWYNKTQIKLFQLKKPYVDWLKLAAVEMAVKIGQNGHCVLVAFAFSIRWLNGWTRARTPVVRRIEGVQNPLSALADPASVNPLKAFFTQLCTQFTNKIPPRQTNWINKLFFCLFSFF